MSQITATDLCPKCSPLIGEAEPTGVQEGPEDWICNRCGLRAIDVENARDYFSWDPGERSNYGQAYESMARLHHEGADVPRDRYARALGRYFGWTHDFGYVDTSERVAMLLAEIGFQLAGTSPLRHVSGGSPFDDARTDGEIAAMFLTAISAAGFSIGDATNGEYR